MANLPFPGLGKRRTREHVIADLSVNHVERQGLLCGFSVERIRLDYGIDLMIQTYNHRGEVENGRIFFQLKATDRIRVSRNGKSILCRVDKADLVYWLKEMMPVVLIQYDARKNVAYWAHVQGTFSGWRSTVGTSKRTTLAIPRINVMDHKTMGILAQKKNDFLIEMKARSHDAD